MRDDLIIQEPAGTAAAPQLLLLFHGVGADAASMRPLGEALSALRPQAFVVSVRSPDSSDPKPFAPGSGRAASARATPR